MKPIAMFAVAAALSAIAGTIGTAAAQQPSPPEDQWGGPGYMMGPRGMMGFGYTGPWMMGWGWGGRGAAMCTAMADHMAGRLAYIKAELKITEAQESLWKAYADASRDRAQAMAARCTDVTGRGGPDTADLPERLDRHEQFMAAQLEALRAVNKALKPLYAALDETQKKAANQLFWGPMGMM
jgi:hypothetical protein